ncbi:MULTISPECIES: helix-turn-helix transcriptional regulator [Bacillaceae]|uniref:helix-turn-helix domain-containing protein n=1 Tax=Bacillaceae TaxID=186817 RepID=UPI001BDECA25|nr:MULTISPECIES: helix-turn-helix transcriptional regulator [Bacillaceae]MDX8363164.1 helix-turn-helix transcriptional regulator [Cytobacillus sp. IB215316]
METENWGRRIRAFRKLKGYTQQSFAKDLGVSITLLGEVERGNRLPSEELVKDISDKLEVSIGELSPFSDL